MINYQTARKNAQGRGSGRAGTHHHWQMMQTSIALVVLVPLFVITFGLGFGSTYEDVITYFSRPFPAIVTAVTLIVGTLHLKMEAEAAIEDYMHGMSQKLTLVGLSAFAYTLIAVGLFAIARIAL